MLPWFSVYFFDIEHPCNCKVFADQYHVTISRAQVYNLSRSRVLWSWPLTKCWFFGDWIAGSRQANLLKTGQYCSEANNASPGLKCIGIITFVFYTNIFCCFILCIHVYGDYKTQNRKSNNKQRTSLQSYKTQIKILFFPGLALLGTEEPGATLLGWPKSIY